jgi:hypothetical protein
MLWTWMQQHRWLSLLALAIVIIGTAGGTTWALVFRTVSSPINLRDALRLYRRDAAAAPHSHAQALNPLTWGRLPRPGVYPLRSSGGESLSIMGESRAFPASTSQIVTDGACATVLWAPLLQHTETTVECPAADGAYVVSSTITHETIGGTTTNATLTCPDTLYLLPPHVRPGARWSAHCTLSNPHEPVSVTGVALGSTLLTIGGQQVQAEHVRLTQTFSGIASGTDPTDYWVVPSDGLIAREVEQVEVTQDGVHYHQSSAVQLTSLTPAQ